MNDNYYIFGGLFVVAILFAITDFDPIESSIPPTPAFKYINGTWGNITASKYNDYAILTEGSGITISNDFALNEITISSSGGSNPNELYCSIGQWFNSYNSTTNDFICETVPAGQAYQNNTASNIGLGQGIFKQKTGVDLEFKGIAVNGDLTISSNETDITISYIDPIGGSGNATVLNDLGDVIITSPAYLSTLFYDGANWIDRIFSINTQTASNGNFITGINNQTGVITTQTFKAFTFDINCSDTEQINRIQYDNQTGTYTGTCETDESGGATARENSVAEWPVDQTKSNIGTPFSNLYTTGLADPFRIDTNGMSTATLIIDWTKVGAGTQACQIVSSTNPSIVLIRFNNLVSGLNTNATQDIATNAENRIDTFRPQCKSTTGTDDPLWHSGQVLLSP